MRVSRTGVKIPVANMPKSRAFYGQVLGLKIQKETRSTVTFEGAIALVPVQYEKEVASSRNNPDEKPARSRSIIYMETRTLDLACAKVQQFGARILTPITEQGGQRFFRCYDPDENVIEMFEVGRGR